MARGLHQFSFEELNQADETINTYFNKRGVANVDMTQPAQPKKKSSFIKPAILMTAAAIMGTFAACNSTNGPEYYVTNLFNEWVVDSGLEPDDMMTLRDIAVPEGVGHLNGRSPADPLVQLSLKGVFAQQLGFFQQLANGGTYTQEQNPPVIEERVPLTDQEVMAEILEAIAAFRQSNPQVMIDDNWLNQELATITPEVVDTWRNTLEPGETIKGNFYLSMYEFFEVENTQQTEEDEIIQEAGANVPVELVIPNRNNTTNSGGGLNVNSGSTPSQDAVVLGPTPEELNQRRGPMLSHAEWYANEILSSQFPYADESSRILFIHTSKSKVEDLIRENDFTLLDAMTTLEGQMRNLVWAGDIALRLEQSNEEGQRGQARTVTVNGSTFQIPNNDAFQVAFTEHAALLQRGADSGLFSTDDKSEALDRAIDDAFTNGFGIDHVIESLIALNEQLDHMVSQTAAVEPEGPTLGAG